MKPASKLPWETAPAAYSDSGEWAISTQMRNVAYVNNGTPERGIAEPNARYIVHACNLYPELVEALRDCAETLANAEAYINGADMAAMPSPALDNARLLLDKCKDS